MCYNRNWKVSTYLCNLIIMKGYKCKPNIYLQFCRNRYYKLNENKHVLSHSSGGYKTDISVFVGLVPSGSCDKTLVSSFFPSFWCFACNLWNSSGVKKNYIDLPLNFYKAFFPVCVCVKIFLFNENIHHNGLGPTLILITSVNSILSSRVLPEVFSLRNSVHEFGVGKQLASRC